MSCILAGAGCSGGDRLPPAQVFPPPDTLRLVVLDSIPHDADAFTQGFEIHNGSLWESTGIYGRSELRVTDPSTGEVLVSAALPDTLFGEGITFHGDRIFQLTWQSGSVLSWDPEIMEYSVWGRIGGQGWGICSIGDSVLVTSDGSAFLCFRDPSDLAQVGTVLVTTAGEPESRLNELEYAEGSIWANQWNSERILRIDPHDGTVTGVAFCQGLLDRGSYPTADVMNGIAWDSERQAFLLTGKLWPWTYVVSFR